MVKHASMSGNMSGNCSELNGPGEEWMIHPGTSTEGDRLLERPFRFADDRVPCAEYKGLSLASGKP
jgi:hypothetical protein